MFKQDKRIVMTLDAGGTNFVFSAIQGNREIVEPVGLPSCPDDIGQCLDALCKGFASVKEQLRDPPAAISFAFPGPADYERGVIGGELPNFPAFREGVALGPFLEEQFGIPVMINNDGNLFAYGEALAGMLPEVNLELERAGNSRRYRNLVGVTLGTGFGAGVVIDGVLLAGDNGAGGDLWIMRNKKYPDLIAEESVSIRAVKRVYAELSGTHDDTLTPKEIYDIAEGIRPGDREAAISGFRELGEMAGAALVNALNIVDGLVVIGGGVAGAAKYILPGMLTEMRRAVSTFEGRSFPCLQMDVWNLEDKEERTRFLQPATSEVSLPRSRRKVPCNFDKRTGIAVSKLGTSKAIALGAYAFALHKLDTGHP